jgi:DNA-binding NarL/FixJ family response regulator
MDPEGAGTHVTHGGGGRYLIIEDRPRLRALLRNFMGRISPAECFAICSDEALTYVEHGAFDAVLIDTHCSGVAAAQLILGILRKAPNLCTRMLIITDEKVDPQTEELIQSFSIAHIPRNRLYQHPWAALQFFFKTPQARGIVTMPAQIAHMVFDSFRRPTQAGVRSFSVSARQLAYRLGQIMIDLLIEPLAGTGRILLMGQVLYAGTPEGEAELIPVIFTPRSGPQASTTTNRFGEFELEFEFVESADLEIRPSEWERLSIPTIDMMWARQWAKGSEV